MSSQPKWSLGSWAYEWNANGSLHKIKRPDGSVITFKYDAFGRRISKSYHRREFLYIWDKNVPLHEIQKEQLCEDNIITWIFEGFTPTAKLINGKAYSIISDHIGTPILAVDTNGVKVWERELDIYGKVRKEFTHDSVKDRRSGFMPFLYQGQYYDVETELAYNRFRYYSPDIGVYISQDPIGLAGNNPTLYGYVFDTNTWIDVFGLNEVLHFKDFDKALKKAFEIAKNGEDNITFTPTKIDPITGTEVEFIGSNGSKIAFDSPHLDMDSKLGHDKPHIGVQSGGKRGKDGAKRYNLTYEGEQHPFRSADKGKGCIK